MKKTLLIALYGSIFLLFTSLSLSAWADTRYELRVDGLACPYCAYGIEKKLKALDGIIDESVEIRLNDGIVRFQASGEAAITESSLKQLINDAGFTLRGLETQCIQQEKRKDDY